MAALKRLLEDAADSTWYSPGEKVSDYYLDFQSTEPAIFNKVVDNLAKLAPVSEIAYQTVICNCYGQIKNLTTNAVVGPAELDNFVCENPFPHVFNMLRKTYYIRAARKYISIICMRKGDETRNVVLVSAHEPPV